MSEESSSSPLDGAVIPEHKEGKSEEVFEVEKILAHKIEGKKFLVKVRWVGYGEDEDTWEPEQDIKECASEVVQEYYSHMKVNDKTELIEALQRNMSRNSYKSKAKKRKMDDDAESPGSDSETSFESGRKASKKSKKKRLSESTSRVPGVPTKAALKSYEVHSTTPATNNAKKAALEVRDQRNHWLEEDSSDDEREAPAETEIEKLANKVKEKAVKEGVLSPKSPSVRAEKSATPSQQPCSSSSIPPIVPNTSNSVNSDKQQQKEANPAPINGQRTIYSASYSRVDDDDPEFEWTVEGIVRHVGEDNVRTKLILMTNRKTRERKVLNSREAFELDGWSLTKYLLDRCEF